MSPPSALGRKIVYTAAMQIIPLDPLGEVAIDPLVAALPKAGTHLRQEWSPRRCARLA